MITKNELMEKYPLAFKKYEGKRGVQFSCGAGWMALLEPLLKYLQEYNSNQSEENYILPIQIKEKFGTLNIYTTSSNDEISSLISKAQLESSKTCADCGEPGILRTGGWLLTKCDLHHNKSN